MGKVAYHVEKGDAGAGGLGHHIDRTEGQEHTYKHADPSRIHLNQNYFINEYCKMSLPNAINSRIEDGYNNERKIRTDAVKYLSHILSGTHEDMIEIFKDKNRADQWVRANLIFLEQEYGKENIVRFSLHLDEKTPHIHAITIPLTSDGRLSAKEVLGNKKQLEIKQTRYAALMSSFGLERGELGSKAKHEKLEDFRRRESKLEKSIDKPVELVVKKNFLGQEKLDKEGSIIKLQDEVKLLRLSLANKEAEHNTALNSLYLQLDRKDEIISGVRFEQQANERTIHKLEGVIHHQKSVINDFILYPEEARAEELKRRSGLVDKLRKDILKEVATAFKKGLYVGLSFLDDCIRKFTPTKEVGERNVWTALDAITGDRGKFEGEVYEQSQELVKALEVEQNRPQKQRLLRQTEGARQQAVQKEEVREEQKKERPRSRGRGM